MKKNCPVCNSYETSIFLERMDVPVHQHQLFGDPESARQAVRGDLVLACCYQCGFVFNTTFDPQKLEYGEAYDNSQTSSPSFQAHVRSLVEHLVADRGVRNSTIVEVGCGKGFFLRELAAASPGNRGFGYDSTYEGPETELDGRVVFQRHYYTGDLADPVPDVVVCRHVIEHVTNPSHELLAPIRSGLELSPDPLVFFETPDVEWILRNRVIWDFFYEHCSYFSAASLATVFQQEGFDVRNIRTVFDGQYLWLEAGKGKAGKPCFDAGSVPILAEEFARAEAHLISLWQAKIRELSPDGKVAIWGAGAKGVTFANLVDPCCEFIDCIVDLNPNKIGNYIPGTGHPIISHKELGRRDVTDVILMNPNYRDENLALMKQEGLDIRLVEDVDSSLLQGAAK
jgi:2-polyprenyl-3-methyl-5-hydroxy-6-metoxy-1,4-benzoquinol methylase